MANRKSQYTSMSGLERTGGTANPSSGQTTKSSRHVERGSGCGDLDSAGGGIDCSGMRSGKVGVETRRMGAEFRRGEVFGDVFGKLGLHDAGLWGFDDSNALSTR